MTSRLFAVTFTEDVYVPYDDKCDGCSLFYEHFAPGSDWSNGPSVGVCNYPDKDPIKNRHPVVVARGARWPVFHRPLWCKTKFGCREA